MLILLTFCLSAILDDAQGVRIWTDSTGNYSVEGTLIARNEKSVVLEKRNKDLVAVPLASLSDADREYLDQLAVQASIEQSIHTWTLKNGQKIDGRVVDYARRDVTIQRYRGRIYVNDKLFENLPESYQKMLPQVVSHFEGVEFATGEDFADWVSKQRGAPRSYVVEGVLLELPNGDLYGVPFFFFSEKALKVLEPGWKRWLIEAGASNSEEAELQEQEEEAFRLRAQSSAYADDQQSWRQIAELQLQLQAYDAGLFSLWEVGLLPTMGYGRPLLVVVPARNSAQATAEAVTRYPGYTAVAVAKAWRK